MGSSGNPLQSVENATTFGEFHRRLWKGEVTLAEKKMKISTAGFIWSDSCTI